MLVKNLKDCEEITAGDNTILREILHPDKQEVDLRYSFAHAIVKPGLTSYLHKLKTSEIYYILEGEGIMHIENEKKEVGVGDLIYIPPNAKQCIKNTGNNDLKFICIVDPAWKAEDETVI